MVSKGPFFIAYQNLTVVYFFTPGHLLSNNNNLCDLVYQTLPEPTRV